MANYTCLVSNLLCGKIVDKKLVSLSATDSDLNILELLRSYFHLKPRFAFETFAAHIKELVIF